MTYIKSDNISVFPTVRRNDEIDRKARLNTEENIVNLSERFTGGQSYILSGLNINEEGTTLSSGVCVIKGYYFKIENQITLDPNNNYLYFHIKLAETSNIPNNISTFSSSLTYEIGDLVKYDDKLWKCWDDILTAGDWTGETNWTDITLYFSEIVRVNEISNNTLDESNSNDFKGLEILFSDTQSDTNGNYYLLIAKKNNNDKWENYIPSHIITQSNFIIDDGEIR